MDVGFGLSARSVLFVIFMNGRAFFPSPPSLCVSTRVEFHFIEKNKAGRVGEGRGEGGGLEGEGGGSRGESDDLRPPP